MGICGSQERANEQQIREKQIRIWKDLDPPSGRLWKMAEVMGQLKTDAWNGIAFYIDFVFSNCDFLVLNRNYVRKKIETVWSSNKFVDPTTTTLQVITESIWPTMVKA
tara:strand:+ start:1071 stop:1394 length:324 start_codon:yes stop_codon:yes gene_type:complete